MKKFKPLKFKAKKRKVGNSNTPKPKMGMRAPKAMRAMKSMFGGL